MKVSLFVLVLLGIAAAHAQEESFTGLEEWTQSSLKPSLNAIDSEKWVLLELYSHWCPACQKFQPTYQQVAAHYADDPRLVVARLDCAVYGDTCRAYEIRGYPTLLLGRPQHVAAIALDQLTVIRQRALDSLVEELDRIVVVVGKPAVTASEKQAPKELDKKTPPSTVLGRRGGVDLFKAVGLWERFSVNDVEGATLKFWKVLRDTPAALSGSEARAALGDWLGLLATSHPSPRCRAGAQLITSKLEDRYWKATKDKPEPTLLDVEICPGAVFKSYEACGAGASRDGFTCGLWQLLHATSAAIPDTPSSGARWLASVRDFARHFFLCSDCSKHFVAETARPEAANVSSKSDAMLWLWMTHNRVNARLRSEEKDVDDRHEQWPPRGVCSLCRDAQGQWDETQVLAFLGKYYGVGEVVLSQAQGQAHSSDRAGGSWGQTLLVIGAVAVALVILMRHTPQYMLPQKSRAV